MNLRILTYLCDSMVLSVNTKKHIRKSVISEIVPYGPAR